jgi:hypothetical protein
MQPVTAASDAAVSAYDAAVYGYLRLSGDPLAQLAHATTVDPSMTAAHALTAAFLLLSSGASGAHPVVAGARRAAAACARRAGGALPREVALLLCVEALAAGRWALAARVLEAQLAAAPADALLLRMAHDIYLFLGDARGLRDSSARVFQTWDPTMPGYAHVCGMMAFGLEETGHYERAEELAMAALHMDPRDAWAAHAAVHVYEMRGQREQGKQLLKESEEYWAESNIFARHLHWHWALFAAEDGTVGYRSALSRCVCCCVPRFVCGPAKRVPPSPPHISRSFDDFVSVPDKPQPPACALTDATSLLWRLEMLHAAELQPALPGMARPSQEVTSLPARSAPGAVAEGTRWEDLASCWAHFLPNADFGGGGAGCAAGAAAAAAVEGRWFAWNDVHAAMALATAARGRPGAPAAAAAGDALRALLRNMEAGAAAAGRAWSAADAEAGDGAFLAARAAALGLPAGAPLGAWAAGRSPRGHAPPPDQARILAAVGLDTARGLVAFAERDFGAAAELLGAARPHWRALGGSHVQRDVLELTLLQAAVEVGGPRGRALASERATVFTGSPRAWHVYGGAMRRSAEEAGVTGEQRAQLLSRAVTAENRAHALGLNQGLQS